MKNLEWPKEIPAEPITDGYTTEQWYAESEIAKMEEEARKQQDYWDTFPNRLMRFDDFLDYKPLPMLIEGYLPKSGIGQIYGKPYSGKTYVTLDLALSVCAGLDHWMGLPLNVKGPQYVCYIAAEGSGPFRDALVSWKTAHPAADLSKLLVLDAGSGGQVIFKNKDAEADPKTNFMRLIREFVALGDEPALIVLDPQQYVIDADENSNREMSYIFKEIKQMADLTGSLLLLVHHTGKDETRGARGASAQLGTMDVVISLVGAKGLGTLTFEKVKGANQPEYPIPYAITSVGIDKGTRKGAYALHSSLLPEPTEEEMVNSLFANDRAKRVMEFIASDPRISISEMGTRLSCDPRQVSKILSELETAGLVKELGSTGHPNRIVCDASPSGNNQ